MDCPITMQYQPALTAFSPLNQHHILQYLTLRASQRYAPATLQTWPKHPLHQCGNKRLYSAARRGASTLSAQVRRATIAAQERVVAASVPWVWGDR
jgi:hypothetical protein